ncbi:MAG: DMT family transporter [Bauldia sp.]
MTPSWRDTVRGIAAMSFSVSVFAANDALTKLAALPPGESMLIRSSAAALLMAAFLVFTRTRVPTALALHPALLARTAADVAATILFVTALFQIPLANSLTIVQVVPLAITAASAIFLREHVGWRRWAAVAVGFLGVLIVMRPGAEGFQPASLLTLTAVIGITIRDLATRAIPPELPGFFVTFAAALANALAGIGVGVFETWQVPSLAALADLAGSGALLAIGHVFLIIAMRAAAMATIAPFRYLGIPVAMVLGYLIWGDRVDAPMLIGVGLIIAAGLYTFARERKLALPVPGEASVADI